MSHHKLRRKSNSMQRALTDSKATLEFSLKSYGLSVSPAPGQITDPSTKPELDGKRLAYIDIIKQMINAFLCLCWVSRFRSVLVSLRDRSFVQMFQV